MVKRQTFLEHISKISIKNSQISQQTNTKKETTMASRSNTSHWETQKCTFSAPNQGDEWKAFYICLVDFLKAIAIDTGSEGDTKKGWKQLHMMFTGEDHQALQTLINNGTITPEDQKVCIRVVDAIQRTITVKEHFWHQQYEILSDLRQKIEYGIHILSNHITTFMNNTKFEHLETEETLKIMLLQHAVYYHQARGGI